MSAMPEPSEREVVKAFGAVALIALASRAALALRDVLLASRLGLGDDVEALIAAASIPVFLGHTLGWSMGQAFLPAFARARAERGEAAARRLLALATGWGAGSLLALGAIAWLGAPVLLRLVAGTFAPAKLALAQQLFLPLAALPALFACASIWAAALTVGGRQRLVGAVLLITPLLEVAWLALHPAPGVAGLSWLRLGGALVELLVLGLALGWRRDASGIAGPGPGWPALGQFASLALGSSIGTISVLVDQAMTAPLGPGAIAALGFGSKVGLGLLGLFDVAFAAVVYPRFAALAAARDWPGLRRTARRWAVGTFAAGAAGTLVLGLFSAPLVRLLFERGSFSAADTALVARVQALLLLQLPFHAAGLVGTRLLSALSRNQALVLVSAINVVVNGVGNLVLRELFGVAGIALSTSGVFVVSSGVLWLLCRSALRRAERDGPAGY